MKHILIILLLLLAMQTLSMLFFADRSGNGFSPEPETQQDTGLEAAGQENIAATQIEQEEDVNNNSDPVPLDNWRQRVTKKPFGIYIEPQTSPVQPEKFQGWHTGTDFEVPESELEKEIGVKAICAGKVLEKKFVGGYGGVVIQSCSLKNKPVTVLYGHLDLSDNQLTKGDRLERNQAIAHLAAESSYYSGNERKHLHLGIHQGSVIDLRGYVQTKNQLADWFDFEQIHDQFN